MSKPSAQAGEVKAFCAVGAEALTAGEPAKVIHLLPMGEFTARDGRAWIVDGKDHAEAVIAASRAYAGAQDIMVDYDHQSVFAARPEVGGQAPAAGWVDPASLEVREDGIWGSVAWTPKGDEKLRAKEYRYVSPYFGSDKQTRRVTRIFNVALTGKPALHELAAVAAVEDQGIFTPMDLTKLAQALGLQADATFDQILAAINDLRNDQNALSTHLQGAAAALGLAVSAKGEEVVAAAQTAQAAKGAAFDPTKFVPIETYNALSTQFTALQGGQVEEKATAAVNDAIKSGKVVPANRDWALGFAKKDLAGFQSFVGNQPAILGERTDTAATKPGAAGAGLEPHEERILTLSGVSRDAFIKAKKD